ncbi:hypothetical protein DFQ30_006189 [Apophysomyces sp. BC1015]|nr:hypothetical protein DFQ30_006189 [Apophysomyces sp. BC1015]
MVLPLIFVTAIDDDPVFQPASKREVEALIQRLDEDGIAAVLQGVQANFGSEDPEAHVIRKGRQMKEFGSLEALAHHLMSETVSGLSQVKRGLELSAELIEETAKSEIGEYQEAVAMFPAWAPLAALTEADKASKGYPPNSPLLRTGEMQDSIRYDAGEWEATVGATDPNMVFHEFGTQTIPPRPVIGPALYRNLEQIQKLIGNAAAAGLVGGDPIKPGLGYTIEGSPD